jgi:hypothetical protein
LQQRTRLLGNEQDSTWIFSKNEKQRHKPRRAHTNRDAPTQTKPNGCDFPHLHAYPVQSGFRKRKHFSAFFSVLIND